LQVVAQEAVEQQIVFHQQREPGLAVVRRRLDHPQPGVLDARGNLRVAS
jgi:hypothetical protein